jgi:restriction system protein
MPKVSKEMTTFVSNIFLKSFVVGFLVLCSGIYFIFSLDLSASFCNGLVVFVLILMIGLPIVQINRHNKEVEKRVRGIQVANIDSMTGIEFEQYLERILIDQGYSVQTTDVSGDLGVDLIATGKGDKIAIQVKRYSTKVSRRAISDAVAGMYHYGCNKAMVVTNNYFSPGAIELAESTECILIDRDTLAQWVNEFQNREAQIIRLSNEKYKN